MLLSQDLGFELQQASTPLKHRFEPHGAHQSTGGFHERESIFMSSGDQIPARPEVLIPASAFSRRSVFHGSRHDSR
jgi:hypothetical protein